MSDASTQVVSSIAVEIPGPAGVLEAAIDSSRETAAAVAVLCHPHPLQAGTMHNKVVTTLARTFTRLGAHAVRFNFRGVGSSAGRYADGAGEREDALSVTAWCRARWPGADLYLGGFSFGAAIAAGIAARVSPRGLVTVAPPLDRLPEDFAAPECRWLLVHGQADDVVPPEPVLAWCASLAVPPQIVLLEGVGHFFHGRLSALADAVTVAFAGDFALPRGNLGAA